MIKTLDDYLLIVPEVRKLLGSRFERVCDNGACLPVRVEDQTMYYRSFVLRGLEWDRERYQDDEVNTFSSELIDEVSQILASLRSAINREQLGDEDVMAPLVRAMKDVELKLSLSSQGLIPIPEKLSNEFSRLKQTFKQYIGAKKSA